LAALKEGLNANFLRHRPVMNLFEKHPRVLAEDIYVAPNAAVVGDVVLHDMASVWYGAVIRGDRKSVTIGPNANIQDRAVVYTTDSLESGFPADVKIGGFTSIGPGAVLYSCFIGDYCLIGAGAKILQGARVESRAVVLPGSVVPPGHLVPAHQVWGGNPIAFVRNLTEDELAEVTDKANKMHQLAKEHLDEFNHPKWGTAHLEAEKIA